MRGRGRRAVLAALAANVAVAATKLIGFVVTGSSALLAETLHSFADTGNQALLLVGARRARQAPSAAHPFGRGRERYFWAFVVGLVLFGGGGVLSIREGVTKLISADHDVTNPFVGIALIVSAMVFEAASLRTAGREANVVRPGDQGWWAFVHRTRNPELAVVLLEDSAALVGLVLALAGIGASWVTGNPMWDASATILIGILLCVVALVLTIEMKSLLIGETISRRAMKNLDVAIAAVDGVERVLDLRTEHLGPDQVLVCVKVEVTAPADLDRVVAVIDAVEATVKGQLPDMLICYVEPDRYDAERIATTWT